MKAVDLVSVTGSQRNVIDADRLVAVVSLPPSVRFVQITSVTS